MYLLINKNEKKFVETLEEIKTMNTDGYKAYYLSPLDLSEIVSESKIRDSIYKMLKGDQMPKDSVIENVQYELGISKKEISKIITKMKKEKIIYAVEGLYDTNGQKWIGIN